MSSGDHRTTVLRALVLAHGAWAVGAFWLSLIGSRDLDAISAALGFAGMAAQAVLLCMWTLLGRGPLVDRFFAYEMIGASYTVGYALYVAAAMAILGELSTSSDAIPFIVNMLCLAGGLWLAAGTFAVVLMAGGLYWKSTADSPGEGWRFSLSGVLVATLWFAMLFAGLRGLWYLTPEPSQRSSLASLVMASVVEMVVASLIAIAGARCSLLARLYLLAINVALAVGVGVWLGTACAPRHAATEVAFVVASLLGGYAMLLSGSLLGLRFAGWHLEPGRFESRRRTGNES